MWRPSIEFVSKKFVILSLCCGKTCIHRENSCLLTFNPPPRWLAAASQVEEVTLVQAVPNFSFPGGGETLGLQGLGVIQITCNKPGLLYCPKSMTESNFAVRMSNKSGGRFSSPAALMQDL